MAAASFSSAFAQRNIDWSVDELIKPTELNSNTTTGTNFDIEAVFKNNGTDTVFSGDTVLVQILFLNASNQLFFAVPNTTSFVTATSSRRFNPGDTMHYHLRLNYNKYTIGTQNTKIRIATLVINRGTNKIADEPTAGQANNVKIVDMLWYNPQKWGVGINEVNNDFLMDVYPNPANNLVTISYKVLTTNTPTQIQIMSLEGRLIKEITSTIGSTSDQVEISDLKPGIYIIKVKNGDLESHQKLQVIR